MNIILAICAALAFSLQSTLMARFFRRLDQLSVLAVRGVCLACTMLTLLLLEPELSKKSFLAALPYGLSAGFFGLIAAFFGSTSYRYLPLGIAGSVSMAIAGIGTISIGHLQLHERLTLTEIVLLGLILVAVIVLGFTRSAKFLPTANFVRGIPYAMLFGVFLTFAYLSAGIGSRVGAPLLVGYLWEASIGITGFVAIGLRRLFGGAGFATIDRQDYVGIFFFSLPTVIASACYLTALSLGPIGLVSAILSITAVFSTVLARIFYNERLNALQVFLIVVVCCCVGALKVVS